MRDLGLLKLFFAASASADEVAALAVQQTEVHQRMLAEYDALNDAIHDDAGEWELATLDLGRRFEQLTIDFWTEVGARARQGRAAPIKPPR